MKLAFALFLVGHGLIHLLGFAKAFAFAELPQLTRPILPMMGVVWLGAALLFLVTAAGLFVWPRWWWVLGAVAITVSTIAIVPSWSDAKFGALANLVVLLAVVYGVLADGPLSLRAAYDRDVQRLLVTEEAAAVVTEADLAPLPVPVQRYLRASGVVGQPRVRNFRVRMHGRIRSGPDARWMPFTAEQHNFDEPARLFYMDASMLLVPFQVLHRYVTGAATMRVKVAGLVSVSDLSGAEMTRAETVTLFNDMCIMAPAMLIDPGIRWQTVDARTAGARFTNAGHTIGAELSFNDAGELTNFWSDDRRKASPDGQTMTAAGWSTPMEAPRAFGAIRLASRGEALWHEEGGAYAYIELELDEVEYNLPAP